MKWYDKYLSVYDKPYASIDDAIFEKVKNNIEKLNSDNPIATIAVISHNEERRLLACLWSLSETKTKYPIEIIGVNNASTDNTPNIFDRVSVKRFDQPNKGFGFARQCGLENAKGKYYIGADSDTIYPNGYVNKIIEAFEKNSSVVGVSVMHKIMAITFKEKLYYLFYDFFRNIYNRITSIKRPELVVRGFAFSHLTSLGREIGYRTDIRRGSDGAMAVSLKNYGKIKFLRKRRISPLSQSTLVGQDSMFSKLFNKIFFEFKRLKMYFTKREDYKDEDSNLMNNKKEGK